MFWPLKSLPHWELTGKGKSSPQEHDSRFVCVLCSTKQKLLSSQELEPQVKLVSTCWIEIKAWNLPPRTGYAHAEVVLSIIAMISWHLENVGLSSWIPQCSNGSDILWNLYEHQLLQCRRVCGSVLFRPVRDPLPAHPVVPHGTPSNHHADSVPEWSCMLHDPSPFKIQQWAAAASIDSFGVKGCC